MRRFAIICALLFAPVALAAEEVVAALSQTRVSITANFDGSEILVFGAIKRDTPAPADEPIDVVITVTGPAEFETIRRKDRRLGIWVNVDSEILGHAPTFYDVATTRPLSDTINSLTDSLWHISTDESILPGLRGNPFREALLRIRKDEGVYRVREEVISLQEQTLFSTSFALPANLTEGGYATRIFLLRNGEVIDNYATSINVQKVGIERWLYRLSRDNEFAYGLLALILAGLAGWGASEAFRMMRRL